MSWKMDQYLKQHGTRFLLYPQPPFLDGHDSPETVWVSSPPGSLMPGPADDRMYLVDPKEAKDFYEHPDALPYKGKCHPPAQPGPGGHFDHLDPQSRAFRNAHMFGTVRRVLDIWESYVRGWIPWHFHMTHPRLEMIPWLDWNNAQFGWGFMEAGYGKDEKDNKQPYALNFDVLAHETGHGLIFSMVGIPDEHHVSAEYRGFHEGASDLVAILSVLHFDSFLEKLLQDTSGNLYVENELNRIGELSNTKQIRLASNAYKMSDCVDPKTPIADLSYKQVHKLGEPLTGAFFDILVEVYQQNLVQFGAIDEDLNQESSRCAKSQLDDPALHERYQQAYAKAPKRFKKALINARDQVGLALAETWQRLDANHLTFADLAKTYLILHGRLHGPRDQVEIANCFRWRQIGYGYTNLRHKVSSG